MVCLVLSIPLGCTSLQVWAVDARTHTHTHTHTHTDIGCYYMSVRRTCLLAHVQVYRTCALPAPASDVCFDTHYLHSLSRFSTWIHSTIVLIDSSSGSNTFMKSYTRELPVTLCHFPWLFFVLCLPPLQLPLQLSQVLVAKVMLVIFSSSSVGNYSPDRPFPLLQNLGAGLRSRPYGA